MAVECRYALVIASAGPQMSLCDSRSAAESRWRLFATQPADSA